MPFIASHCLVLSRVTTGGLCDVLDALRRKCIEIFSIEAILSAWTGTYLVVLLCITMFITVPLITTVELKDGRHVEGLIYEITPNTIDPDCYSNPSFTMVQWIRFQQNCSIIRGLSANYHSGRSQFASLHCGRHEPLEWTFTHYSTVREMTRDNEITMQTQIR